MLYPLLDEVTSEAERQELFSRLELSIALSRDAPMDMKAKYKTAYL